MVLTKSVCLRYYKRNEIQEELILQARNKEVGVRYNEGFGKRPDILTYPRDVLELAKQNATSFHCSEELWENPLNLSIEMSKKELEELRTGWDLVLDIDCKIFEYSRICANLIIKFLKYCDVTDYSIKFSGNKGFHIGIPFGAFPQEVSGVKIRLLFPEAAKKIALYVKDKIEEELSKQILAFEGGDVSRIKDKFGLEQEDILRYEQNSYGDKVGKLNTDKFLEIDTILISSRHLYRMPYSLHEKSGLVSLPLDPEKVLEFEKAMAHPDLVKRSVFVFLNRKVSSESARKLLLQAIDYHAKVEHYNKESNLELQRDYDELVIESPITEEFFPPCIKKMLQGMDDGKKRAVFCMTGFLGKLGWDKKGIEDYLRQWNREKNNHQPLRENYFKGQMSNFNPGEKLPPNCANDSYYKGIGVCEPDGLCMKIKNPVNYALIRWKQHLEVREEKEIAEEKRKNAEEREEKRKVKEEEKEKRRKKQ